MERTKLRFQSHEDSVQVLGNVQLENLLEVLRDGRWGA